MNKEGWKYKKLGEVCCPKKDIRRANSSFAKDDEIYYIDISSIDNSIGEIVNPSSMLFKDAPSRAQQVVEKDDIVISLVRPNLKNIAMVKQDKTNLVASSGFCVLRAKKDEVHNKYIYYFVSCNSTTDYLVGLTTGAAYPAITESDVKDMKIPVPPLSDQEAIVAELDLLSSVIEKQKKQLEELDTLAQSIFYDMFGDPVENEKGWEVKKIQDIGYCCSGGTPSRKNQSYFEGDIIWYSAGELNSLYIDDSIEKITKEALDNSAAKLCPAYSLFVGMYDTAAFKLGITTKEACSNQACANIQLYTDNVIWLYYTLLLMREEALKSRHGARQKNLNLGFIKDFSIPLPPLPLQQAFAEKISAIEAQKAGVKAAMADTQRLFDYTMDKYFG